MARTAHASANTRPLCILFSPLVRPGILSGQCRDNPIANLVHRTLARDPVVLRSRCIARGGPLSVVVDQRPRLSAVDLEALSDRVLAVVVALHKRLDGLVVAALDPRRVELHVVGTSRSRMNPAPAHAGDDLLVGHVDLEHVIDPYITPLHGFGLRDGAREAIEEIALRAVTMAKALLDQADDDVVGDQLPGIHYFSSFNTQRRRRCACGAQDVAGGDLRDAELLADEIRLRAFAGARRSEQNQPHASILRTASRSCGVSTPGGMSISLTATAMR